MSEIDGRCDRCRRIIFQTERKASFAEIFDFVAMEPERTIMRCSRCTRKVGRPHSNARPYDGNMAGYEGYIRW